MKKSTNKILTTHTGSGSVRHSMKCVSFPDSYCHEATYLPTTATRDGSPAIGGSAGSGAGGIIV
jgi:hypothetical protein